MKTRENVESLVEPNRIAFGVIILSHSLLLADRDLRVGAEDNNGSDVI